MSKVCGLALFAALNSLFLFVPASAVPVPPDSSESFTDAVDLTWSATFQPRVGFGIDEADSGDRTERFGFGVRRARLRLNADFSDQFGTFFDVDLSSGSLSVASLFGYYKPSGEWSFRAGYIPGAQPMAYSLTSHRELDLMERAAIAELWGRNTIGSNGRDFGVDATWVEGDVCASLFLHGGDGNFNRLRGNFRQSVSSHSATRGVDRTAAAISSNLLWRNAFVDGLELGAFASYNGSENPNTEVQDIGRSFVSYEGHVYYGAKPGSRPVRLKLDVIGVQYEEVTGTTGNVIAAQNTLGVSVMGAVRIIDGLEMVTRLENYMPDDGSADVTFFGAGLVFSLSARRGLAFRRQRLTLAYTSALPDGSRADLIELQGQWVF